MHIDIEKARRRMAARGLDAMVAGSLTNTYYCTGHYSPHWFYIRDQLRLAVIPKNSEPFVVTPDVEAKAYTRSGAFRGYEFPMDVYFKYPEGVEDLYLKGKHNIAPFEDQLQGLDVRKLLIRTPVLLLAEILSNRNLDGARIGIDKEYIETEFFEEIVDVLPGCEWQDCSEIFKEMRMIKGEEELDCMVRATRITEEAIRSCFPMVREGVTVGELLNHTLKAMSGISSETGGYCEAWERGVVSTPIPAGETRGPLDVPVKVGQTIRWDIGCRYNHYCADVGRQVAIGDIPQSQIDFYYSVILEASAAMVEKIRPGVKAHELYQAVHSIVEPVDPDYSRRLFNGHGLGIELHEEPYITPWSQIVLEPGMVIAVEVPYYVAGGYAWNYEDMYLVTQEGHRLLSDGLTSELLKLG